MDSFPDTEVLNRNKDDIEKRKQVKSNFKEAAYIDNKNTFHKIIVEPVNCNLSILGATAQSKRASG